MFSGGALSRNRVAKEWLLLKEMMSHEGTPTE